MYNHPHIRFATPTANESGVTSGQLPTLAELKEHLRVDFDDDDTYITQIIASVTSYIEDYCDVKFGEFTYEVFWDHAYPVVNVPKKFVEIVTSVTDDNQVTTDTSPKLAVLTDGAYVDVASGDYNVDYVSNPIRVHMKSGFSEAGRELNRYRLTFRAKTRTVPQYVHQAFLMIAGHYYENRQDVGKERIFEVPMNSRYLLDRYREQSFC